MADEVTNAQLVSNATGPAEVQMDGSRVRQQPVGDLIKLQNHLASQGAMSHKRRGLRFSKFRPPSARGE